MDGARGVSLDGRGRVRRREVDGDRGLRGLGRQQSDLALELFDVELDWGQRVLEPQRVLDARRVRQQLEQHGSLLLGDLQPSLKIHVVRGDVDAADLP